MQSRIAVNFGTLSKHSGILVKKNAYTFIAATGCSEKKITVLTVNLCVWTETTLTNNVFNGLYRTTKFQNDANRPSCFQHPLVSPNNLFCSKKVTLNTVKYNDI